MSPSSRSRLRPVLLALGITLIVGACGSGPSGSPAAVPSSSAAASPSGSLTVYSGRSEELVAPILARFEEATGVTLEVRYAGTSELAATILEEGANSPADVFLSQDGGALGALAKEGLLAALPADVVGRVDPRFAAGDGTWVGLSGRARVLAYDTRELSDADLPASVTDLADPAWKGRIGWVPTNASFQTFVTALRVQLGEEAARAWLEAVQANDPRAYEGNAAAVAGVAAGEVDVALVNHYYLYQARAETPDLPVANHFFTGGDPGALVNVAGIGILGTAKNLAAAEALVRFLLDAEAQTYFATKTFEYALVEGIAPADGLPALADIQSPDLDLTDLDDIEGTVRLLQEAGVL